MEVSLNQHPAKGWVKTVRGRTVESLGDGRYRLDDGTEGTINEVARIITGVPTNGLKLFGLIPCGI